MKRKAHHANPYVKRFKQAYQVGRSLWGAYKTISAVRKPNSTERQVTNQYDLSTVYRRKRMPGRRRQRWVRKLRLYRAMSQKQQGNRIQIYQYSDVITSTAGQQAKFSNVLFGYCGNQNYNGNNDLARIRGTEQSADDSGVSANTAEKKLVFKSAVMDVTMHNVGTNTAEIDLFYFYVTKKTVGSDSCESLWSNAVTNQTNLIAAGAGVNSTSVGATPFDFPYMCRYIKITKVKKLILAPGQISSLIIRNPRNKVWSTSMIANEDAINGEAFGIKGFTQGVLCVFKGAPAAMGAAQGDTASVRFSQQNKYHYILDSAKTGDFDFIA